MKKKTRNILLSVLTGALLLCAIAGGTVYYYLFAPQFHPSKTVYVYVDRDDTADSIYNKIRQTGHVNKFTGFQWMAKYRKFDQNIHTGRYAIRPNENVYHVFSRFFRGYQEPMNLTIGSVRTLDRLDDRLRRDSPPTIRFRFSGRNGVYAGHHALSFHPRDLSGILGYECRRLLQTYADRTQTILE